MSNQNLHQQIIEIQKDNISFQRSLVRIESTVMDIRSILLRRARSTSSHRPSNQKENPITPSAMVNTPKVINSTPIRTRRRELLQNIANRPISNSICWYHKQFGIAANPLNCQPGCTFLASLAGKPMKNINKSRESISGSEMSSCSISTSVAASSNPSMVIRPSNLTNPGQDNTNKQEIPATPMESLENDLLMSDSD